MSGKLNIDVLAKELIAVDEAAYDHPNMGKVFKYLATCTPEVQQSIIETALGVEYDIFELMDHVRSQFVILQQSDAQGDFCGLGFGDNCVSVATWDGLDLPTKPSQVDVTKICYKDKGGKMRCGHLLDFTELWMEMNEMSFGEFLQGVNIETVQ